MARENTQEELENELKDEPGLHHRPRAKWTPEMEEQVERQRQANVLAATIAGLSWGKAMSPLVRRAFAAYCARYDVDPITEMDNLGGVPYVNADWYKRKLGELIVRGIVKDYTLEHIQADARLEKMMRDPDLLPEMRDEARKRWFTNAMKRVEQNAPEEAKAVCICTINLTNGAKSVGCKWAGGGTAVPQFRHGGGKEPNPIAEANPTLSVESMSIRRALSQLVSHVTGERLVAIVPDVATMTDELKDLQEVAVREAPPSTGPDTPIGQKAITQGNYDEEADAGALAERLRASREERESREAVPVDAVATARSNMSAVQILTAADDPYGFDTHAELNNLEPSAPSTPASRERESAPAGAVGELQFDAGREVSTGPRATTVAPDLFGRSSRVEPTSFDVHECESCENQIRRGHPEDHKPDCDGYREV